MRKLCKLFLLKFDLDKGTIGFINLRNSLEKLKSERRHMFLQNCIDKDEQYIRNRWLIFSIAWAAFPIIRALSKLGNKKALV